MTAAITFTNLVKTYGKQQAVADLSIEVQKGRITGFWGQTAPVNLRH
jgi:ABC-2 type transport system ATP-binding protein